MLRSLATAAYRARQPHPTGDSPIRTSVRRLSYAPLKRYSWGALAAVALLAAACSNGGNGEGDADLARQLANPSTAGPTTAPAPAARESDGARVAQDGDRVAVHYHGTLDSGEVFDSSLERDPFVFVVGAGQVIAGFDEMVRGLAVGEKVTRRLEPSLAYGERQEDLILEVPRVDIPDGLVEGDSIRFTSGATGVIIELTADIAKIDANHRLAGQALTFELELVEFR